MKASVRWINRYLEPGDLTVEQAEQVLTDVGFPIDAREPLPDGDARLEVEVTSNRGDCLSHIGLAREIAARTGRRLLLPQIPSHPTAGDVREVVALENTVPEVCPRFTVQVIRGVKIGPSPAWMRGLLEAVGQRSINNVVDVTNWLNFEYGQPCHAFDLAKLAGRKLVVRMARDGEMLTTLDGKQRRLRSDEIVVADAERATSLAGVIGGGDSEVSESTTDVVLEVATWDPVAVRRAARRHQAQTDASHRFERYVDPRTIAEAARRAAALIVEVAGGTLCAGMLDEGRPAEPARVVRMRPERCRAVLGTKIRDEEMAALLSRLGLEVKSSAEGLVCTIPPWRPDLEREIDLIEEVGRLKGFDAIPMGERIQVAVRGPQESERAVREIGNVLTGLGFYETVTFSFVTPAQAKPFLPQGLSLLAVDDERRRHDGTLRPSVLPSLLACRKKNQDGGVEVPGGIRLYETGAVFAEEIGTNAQSAPTTNGVGGVRERRVLALLMDVPGVGKGKAGTVEERQAAVRLVRGAVESIARALGGAKATVEIRPGTPPAAAFDPKGCGEVLIGGASVGWLGMIDAAVQRQFDLAIPVAAAELDLAALVALYPPASSARLLPAFPPIERDLSLVVDEGTPWAAVREMVEGVKPALLEAVEFVGTYRGKQVGAGKKSVTLRLRFRDPERTLRHEEVDPQVGAVIAAAAKDLRAEVRK